MVYSPGGRPPRRKVPLAVTEVPPDQGFPGSDAGIVDTRISGSGPVAIAEDSTSDLAALNECHTGQFGRRRRADRNVDRVLLVSRIAADPEESIDMDGVESFHRVGAGGNRADRDRIVTQTLHHASGVRPAQPHVGTEFAAADRDLRDQKRMSVEIQRIAGRQVDRGGVPRVEGEVRLVRPVTDGRQVRRRRRGTSLESDRVDARLEAADHPIAGAVRRCPTLPGRRHSNHVELRARRSTGHPPSHPPSGGTQDLLTRDVRASDHDRRRRRPGKPDTTTDNGAAAMIQGVRHRDPQAVRAVGESVHDERSICRRSGRLGPGRAIRRDLHAGQWTDPDAAHCSFDVMALGQLQIDVRDIRTRDLDGRRGR